MAASTPAFCSHSSTDSEFAHRLVRDLEEVGIHVWISDRDIKTGVSWAQAVGKALQICDIVILILSPDSIASPEVENEYSYALNKKKKVIPILYRQCEKPYRLDTLEHVDFTGEYDSAFHALLEKAFGITDFSENQAEDVAAAKAANVRTGGSYDQPLLGDFGRAGLDELDALANQNANLTKIEAQIQALENKGKLSQEDMLKLQELMQQRQMLYDLLSRIIQMEGETKRNMLKNFK